MMRNDIIRFGPPRYPNHIAPVDTPRRLADDMRPPRELLYCAVTYTWSVQSIRDYLPELTEKEQAAIAPLLALKSKRIDEIILYKVFR